MRISRHLAITLVAAVCLALSAAPSALAQTKVAHYAGTTRDGDPLSFTLVGSKVTQLKTYVPSLCGSSDAAGLPLHGTDPFDPTGPFPLGQVTRKTAKRANAIWNTDLVTKNFVVSLKRGRHGSDHGRLHVDYSFLMILYTYPISSRPYVCTGDTTFSFKA